MTFKLQPHQLFRISEFISARMGLHFPEGRWHDLGHLIESASSDFGFDDIEEFINWLTTSSLTKGDIETLASRLTVGETYFFREKRSFEVLESELLPGLIQSRQGRERRLRIWTAGCSTGEEPYSIAIMLSRVIPDLKDWNITILATDINPRVLKKAAEGVYSDWSFRDNPPWVRERYFRKKKEGGYEILPQFRKMVSFEYLNLAEDVYPSLLNNTNAMDLIFCRNVLMYFSTDQARKTVHGFYNSLVDNGLLLVGPTDAVRSLSSQFVPVHFDDFTLYKKDINKPQPVEEMRRAVTPAYVPPVKIEPEVAYPPTETVGTGTGEQGATLGTGNREQGTKIVKQTGPDPYLEARMMFEGGRYREAADRLAGLPLNDPKASSLLSRVYANQGRLDDALASCRKAISVDTVNPGHYYLLSTILQEQGQTEEAVKSLKKALYLDQDFVLAYFALGNIMQRQGEMKSSRKYFKNALDILSGYKPEDLLPESDGITAERLSEIIASMIH